VLKELVDNALDACEEAGIAPKINVAADPGTGTITIADNGPGITPETVKSLLDFSVRVSSREAYASPTRGAQGNALKTMVATPFALDGSTGVTTIQACGVRHTITFAVDSLRQQPKIDHAKEPADAATGTSITVHWPVSASLQLAGAKSRFLQIAADYAWLNPHLSLNVVWDGERMAIEATDPTWRKWKLSDPTSAHWYDLGRIERLIAAYVAADQDRGRTRTVREFISDFRGLSGSAKQKAVLDATGMARTALADLFTDGIADRTTIKKLLAAMKGAAKAVKPPDLGIVGKDHFAAKFTAVGADPESFNYTKTLRTDDGIPAVIEIAFGYCPDAPKVRRIITGVNWSVGINDPFKNLGPYSQSLDGILTNLRAGRNEPTTMVVHLACPRISYTDRGKGSLVLTGEITEKDEPVEALPVAEIPQRPEPTKTETPKPYGPGNRGVLPEGHLPSFPYRENAGAPPRIFRRNVGSSDDAWMQQALRIAGAVFDDEGDADE
jgi:DNA topoisomerase VI subunit B